MDPVFYIASRHHQHLHENVRCRTLHNEIILHLTHSAARACPRLDLVIGVARRVVRAAVVRMVGAARLLLATRRRRTGLLVLMLVVAVVLLAALAALSSTYTGAAPHRARAHLTPR